MKLNMVIYDFKITSNKVDQKAYFDFKFELI